MTDCIMRRARSLQFIEGLGYTVSTSLPLLESTIVCQDREAIIKRLLALYGIVALAFGWDERRVPITEWLWAEQLHESLSQSEKKFLIGNGESAPSVQWGLEGLFALAWACNLTELSILDPVPDDFVALFPSISRGESTQLFRQTVGLRPSDELLQELDLLYCLTSALTELELLDGVNGSSQAPPLLAILQRRRALEWLHTDVPWDEIELDT